MKVEIFESANSDVSKFVFTGEDFVAESVLYKYGSYEKRTVICCSTQSGCRVGCKFCGTGEKFIRNLTDKEIVKQVKVVMDQARINQKNIKKFQIMFMSMGEPMHNWENVKKAVRELHKCYPKADLLISTVGIDDIEALKGIIELSCQIKKIGLQFSIHKSNDEDRDKLIPFKEKLSLEQIRDFGTMWWKLTERKPYLNYCIDGSNDTEKDKENLMKLFSPAVFNLTFSVVCSKNENMKEAGFKNLEKINSFSNNFLEKGYDVRVFDPAGQDDIGGGCGQLWYTQEWIKKYLEKGEKC